MVARNKLKEYALKIFNGDKDYSLQKVYRLFPKYFLKIAFFYTELVSQKQEELTRNIIKQLGYIKAVEMRKIAASAHREMLKYRNKALNDLETLDKYTKYFDVDKETAAFYASIRYDKNVQILKDVKDIALVNREALRSVEKTAQKYRYNDIFTEAASYEIKNEEILWQVIDAVKEAEIKIDQYEQKYQYKES